MPDSKDRILSAIQWMRILFAAAIVLPLLTFVWAAWRSYHNHFMEAAARLIRTVDIVSEHAIKVFETQELVFGQVNQMLRALSDADIQQQEAVLHAQFKFLTDSLEQVQDIRVIDTSGRALAAGFVYPVPRDIDISDREYFRVHRDGLIVSGAGYISEVVRGRLSGIPFFLVSKRRESQSFSGIITISIEPKYFQNYYERVAAVGFNTLALVRADGRILARHPKFPDDMTSPPVNPAFVLAVAKTPDRGVYETFSPVDHTERLISYRKISGYPLYVAVGLDRRTIVAEWRAAMSSHLLFGVPATLGLVTLAFLALRRTQQETLALQKLQQETKRRRATEDQLHQAQKMDAIGQLTGGIAHDFNNLLTIVIGSLDLLIGRLPEEDNRNRQHATNALTGARRAATLTQRLLSFARRQPLEPRVVEANKLVAGMSDLLRRTLGEQIHLETVFAGGLWQIFADPNQLENVLINLAVNARDAMRTGGRLTIETANAHLDDAYAASHGEVSPGQYVVICVTDTGVGMSPEVVTKAFEPFFTTKPVGEGTGLGLSQAYGFAKQSRGHLKIYSEVGHGTTVKLYLPRHEGSSVGVDDVRENLPITAAAGEIILVVEDEAAVRSFTVDALREIGYQVLEAGDGAKALVLLANNPGIGLLLSDVVLPKLNGRALAEQACKDHPNLKVLFMTGYTRNAIVHNGMLDPGVALISKPFTISQLATKVQDVLAGRSESSFEGVFRKNPIEPQKLP